MIKKVLIILALVVLVPIGGFYIIGKGWLAGPYAPGEPVAGPRPVTVAPAGEPRILFGDLHNHTNYSADAYVFNMSAVKGGGITTVADACDFARYCSALDFWSINDHAESLSPRVWAETLDAIRDCNAQSGDPAVPDMVAYAGWEWSNGAQDDVPSHYGHKNVIFRTWEPGQVPVRPIASRPNYVLAAIPAVLRGLFALSDGVAAASTLSWYFEEIGDTPACPDDVHVDDLPLDCREVALTPRTLYRKLDEWGFDALVIPHGLAWGTTNPVSADFRNQLDQHEQRYQKLLEVYSGHGNSERFEDFERIGVNADGSAYCPEPSEHFTPCCYQAGEIVRSRCADPASAACEAEVVSQVAAFVEKGVGAGRKLIEDASLEDWAGCGQLRNSFQPSSLYVPRQSAQYNLALAFDEAGEPNRARFGLIGSSDGHQARPGSSYKESNRVLYTDTKSTGDNVVSTDFYKADRESAGFYYTGGLVAVHAQGRDRDAIWRALDSRHTYATSGDRMLVWFDLLNGPSGPSPMGSEVQLTEVPKFRVRALGAFEQQAGCPDYAVAALGQARLNSLCGGECYNPGGDVRKPISRIEIVRIRPQVSPDERVAPLVENLWRVFDCPAQGEGCEVEFEDPDYLRDGRSALYYARVIQAEEPLIVGDPFGCEYDEAGNCVSMKYCIGENASRDNDCLAVAEPRAWSSPIFVERP